MMPQPRSYQKRNSLSGADPGSQLDHFACDRLQAILSATEARCRWLHDIGIQAPLRFAWVLAKAQRLSQRHLEELQRACPSPTQGRASERRVGASMFRSHRPAGLTPDSSKAIARLLHRSLYYSWTNYELSLFLGEDSMDRSLRALVEQLSAEMRQLLDTLEDYDPDLHQGPSHGRRAEPPFSDARSPSRIFDLAPASAPRAPALY